MQRPNPGRYVLSFVAIQTALFALVLIDHVHEALIVPLTEALAAVAAALMMAFDTSVLAQGILIHNVQTGFAVEIAAGCNGVEPMIMLIAAMIAFPATVRDKLFGIAIGVLAIQVLNTARIITLFYIGQRNLEIFEWAHLYLWPAMILIDALVVWLLWVRHLQRRKHATA
ncbi:MAG: exosortase H [Pseudomonadota bacterium]|nr:exosortase H [Pseudomonadota bacterium]